jgi:hypothetical protein
VTTTHRLITGKSGSGKTYHLTKTTGIYIDLADPPRDVIRSILDNCTAPYTTKDSLAQLTEKAIIAISTETRPLLIDNLELGSERFLRQSIGPLCDAAKHGIIATADTSTPAKLKRIESLTPKLKREEAPPLPDSQAAPLIWNILNKSDPAIARRATEIERHIIRTANQNPGAVIAYANRIKQNGLTELRLLDQRTRHINISFLLIGLVIATLYVLRFNLPFETMSDQFIIGGLIAATMLTRLLFYKSARETMD